MSCLVAIEWSDKRLFTAKWLDGFASADFGDDEGEFTTGPVKVDGPRLLLNVDPGALGRLQVGLADETGAALAGFALDDSEAVRANSTEASVRFKGKDDVSSLAGKTVRVTFRGRRAKLYSLRFAADHAE